MQFVRKAILLLVLLITMTATLSAPAFANGGRGGYAPKPKPVFNVQLCHEGGPIEVNLFNIFELLRHLCHGDKLGPCGDVNQPE